MAGNRVNDLFEMAIAAERGAQEIYTRMAGMFHTYPDVAEFWQRYAAEEAGHATWLNNLRARLASEKLAEPADPLMLETAGRVIAFSIEGLLGKVENLDDAYQLASEMEGYQNGETGDTDNGTGYSQFAIKRGYFRVTKELLPWFDAHMTFDVTTVKDPEEAGYPATNFDGSIAVRIKYAYGKFKLPDFAFFTKPFFEVGVVHCHGLISRSM